MPTVRQRYGQMDRRTDGRLTIAIPRFALRASGGKKLKTKHKTERNTSVCHTLDLPDHCDH